MKIIHINRNIIQSNSKHNKQDPVIRIQEGDKTTYAMSITINGPSKMVYNPNKPLRCGAKLWIETNSEIFVNNIRKKEIEK